MDKLNLKKELTKLLGPEGLNLEIKRRYPKFSTRLIIHRGHLCTLDHGRVWSGDINFTLEEAKLKRLANKLKLNLYLLREGDVDVVSKHPALEKTLIKITPKKVIVSNHLLQVAFRNKKGKWEIKNEINFIFPNV